MLSARAYSLRQKSRLAISLSWVGGYTNLVSLVTLGTVVSHVTGTATNFGKSIGEHNAAQFYQFAWLLLTFAVGAVLSAMTIEVGKRNGWRSKYILPIAIETVLLGVAGTSLWLDSHPAGRVLWILIGLLSLAMGLQNATITKISGAVVRTTHLTGIVTDLGIEGVQYLLWLKDRMKERHLERAMRLMAVSRRHPSGERLLLLACIAVSFIFGAAFGWVIHAHWPAHALALPICFLLCIVYVDFRAPIADIREMDLVRDPELKLQDLLTLLLPREVVLYRFACAREGKEHRAPNFQLWLARVPDHCRVVILAISPLTRFDANSIMDLDAAVRALNADGRSLIISGITPAHFKMLAPLRAGHILEACNLCSDLEFAIARAMAIVQSGPTSGWDATLSTENSPDPKKVIAA